MIAVTGVDGRNRILIEAGARRHLDYAAPGAGHARRQCARRRGAGARHFVRRAAGRGPDRARLSPAAPGRRAAALASVDAEAERLGKRYGRGLVCGACRTPPR
ncbi:MAG: hypothetical protein WDN24_06295 [Sphingomonas sp.]